MREKITKTMSVYFAVAVVIVVIYHSYLNMIRHLHFVYMCMSVRSTSDDLECFSSSFIHAFAQLAVLRCFLRLRNISVAFSRFH